MKLNILLIILMLAVLVGFYKSRKDQLPKDETANRTLVWAAESEGNTWRYI